MNKFIICLALFAFLISFNVHSQNLSLNNLLELRLKNITQAQTFFLSKNWIIDNHETRGNNVFYNFYKGNPDKTKKEFFTWNESVSNKNKSVTYTFMKKKYYEKIFVQCKNAGFRILNPTKDNNIDFLTQYVFKGKGVIIEFYVVNVGPNKNILTYNISIMDELFYSKYKNL